MALFDKQTGGFMDQIRCDEPEYLIWKWRPRDSEPNKNRRENAIRWGSSLRVKEGEVAVFAYAQEAGSEYDYLEGPYDEIIKTKNFPVLASIVGLAYEGGTPFQAEVYYINLARIVQVQFAVPYFDIYDPRFLDFGVPVAVRGRISFSIKDYKDFIKLHRLSEFDLKAFQTQIRDATARYVKNIVTNIPMERNLPVVQIERALEDVNNIAGKDIRERLDRDFGVNVTEVDINAIEVDKISDGYQQLKSVTQDIAAATVQAQAAANIKNIEEMQRINAENVEGTMRIQREETQYAQRKQTQGANFAAYQLEQQAAVGIAGAEALGKMGEGNAMSMGSGGGGGDSMNPAAMMTGMAMGGAIGQNMAGMMNNMMGGVNQPSTQSATPPPLINTVYHVAVNGQPTGPYDIPTLTQMAIAGGFTRDSMVWKAGMANWAKAGEVQELQAAFGTVPPVPTDIPPVPPTE